MLSANLATVDENPTYATQHLRADKAEFAKKYDRQSFLFSHNLHQNELFTMERVGKLAQKMMKSGQGFTSINFKQASINDKIRSMPPEEQFKSTIENLGQSGSWIRMSHSQDYDEDYATLLAALLEEIETLSGQPLKRDITWATMTLFLSSPGITTPFHIDHGPNFLFQVRGDKQVCLFEPTDRELVPYAEVENYYFGNGSAANYRPELQNRGTVYEMKPGSVVHHPHLAPHWVKNSDNISVSVSIAYCFRPLEQEARVYQANFMLRRLGLNPKPPGAAPRSDALKRRLMSRFEIPGADNYHDILYGPVDRIKSPLKNLKQLVKRGS